MTEQDNLCRQFFLIERSEIKVFAKQGSYFWHKIFNTYFNTYCNTY